MVEDTTLRPKSKEPSFTPQYQRSYLAADSLSIISKNSSAVQLINKQVDLIKSKELPSHDKRIRSLEA